MSDLLPCPFCGGEARIEQHEKGKWLAFCGDVYGCGTEGWYESTPEEAIAAWNRRTPAIPPDVREIVRLALAEQRARLDNQANNWRAESEPYAEYQKDMDAIDAALSWLDAQEPTP